MKPEFDQEDDPALKLLLAETEEQSRREERARRFKVVLLILIGAVVPLLLILLATILSLFAGEGGTWGKSLVGFAIFVGIGLLLIFSWFFANRE